MAESWIRKAGESIQEKAEDAYKMCEEVAKEQHLELDWVILVFKTRFDKVIKEKGGEG